MELWNVIAAVAAGLALLALIVAVAKFSMGRMDRSLFIDWLLLSLAVLTASSARALPGETGWTSVPFLAIYFTWRLFFYEKMRRRELEQAVTEARRSSPADV